MVLEYNALQAGLFLAPLSLSMFAVALFTGKPLRSPCGHEQGQGRPDRADQPVAVIATGRVQAPGHLRARPARTEPTCPSPGIIALVPRPRPAAAPPHSVPWAWSVARRDRHTGTSRGSCDYGSIPQRSRGRVTPAALLHARSALAAMLGGALLLVIVSKLYTWLPTHLERAYGLAMPASQALHTRRCRSPTTPMRSNWGRPADCQRGARRCPPKIEERHTRTNMSSTENPQEQSGPIRSARASQASSTCPRTPPTGDQRTGTAKHEGEWPVPYGPGHPVEVMASAAGTGKIRG